MIEGAFGAKVPEALLFLVALPTTVVQFRFEIQSFPAVLRVLVGLTVFAVPLVVAHTGSAAEYSRAELGLYALGAFPSDGGLFAQGGTPLNSKVANGAGAGIKAGVFLKPLGNIVGLQLESFANGSAITFSSGTNPGSSARTNLWVFNSMFNLIFRYPGDDFLPYIGVGGGLSNGMLTNPNIPGRTDTDFEGCWTFGYQFLGGVEANLTTRLYLFSEYKYLAANFHWTQLALDYRSQYVLFGIGLRF